MACFIFHSLLPTGNFARSPLRLFGGWASDFHAGMILLGYADLLKFYLFIGLIYGSWQFIFVTTCVELFHEIF